MGEVYRAEQLDTEGQALRDVALKMIRPEHVSDANFASRFSREVRVATRLRSPHTVTVYDVGQGEDGQLFFSMELIEGPTLRELLNTHGSLPLERAVPIVQQICLALSEAHGLAEPIIHRDLKPANIFVEQQHGHDWVKVGDFGIAKVLSEHTSGLTQTGMSPGTPRYMAPEQWRGKALDGRADLYAVGIMLYELLLGQPPFGVDGDPTSLMYKHLEEVPPALPAMVPVGIRGVVEQLLAKEPAERLPDALSVSAALESSLAALQQPSDDERTLVLSREERPGPELQQPLVQEEQDRHDEQPESRTYVPPPPTTAPKQRAKNKRLPFVGMGLVGLVLLLGGIWYLLPTPAEEETFRPPVETAQQAEQQRLVQEQKAQEAAEKRRQEQEQQEAEREKLAAEEARQRAMAQQQAEKEKQLQEEQQLEVLFLRAEEQVRAQRLTTPKGNNALETYREILQLKPEHKEALDGIQQLKTQYVQLAEKVKRQGEWEKADDYYEKALSIDPQDIVLQKLRQETAEEKKQAVEEAQRKAAEEARQREVVKQQGEEAERKKRVAEDEKARQQEIAQQQAEKEKQQQKYKNMVQIPAGTFWMGCNSDVDKGCSEVEKPGREVYLDAFRIDTYEVTVADYRRCVEAGKCSKKNLSKYDICNSNKSDRTDHPINCVDWNQALRYCTWLEKRLPTEAEWEKAARGAEGWVYPWGNTWDASKANTSEGKLGRTAKVGSYPSGMSPYKVQDMAGNVWEWVQDRFAVDYYQNGPARNPQGPDTGERRSVRGGCFAFNRGYARVAYRSGLPPGYINVGLFGFRCASS